MVGVQVLMEDVTGGFQLALHSDLGNSNLTVDPTIPAAWTKIGQTSSFSGAGYVSSPIPDATPGVMVNCVSEWYVGVPPTGPGGGPAPQRFRASWTSRLGVGVIRGFNPRNTVMWVRWLRP
jgi:hypothetical protein